MDKIDRKIINLLQKNARASLKELSKECFISSPGQKWSTAWLFGD